MVGGFYFKLFFVISLVSNFLYKKISSPIKDSLEYEDARNDAYVIDLMKDMAKDGDKRARIALLFYYINLISFISAFGILFLSVGV